MCRTIAVRALVLLFVPSLFAVPVQWRIEDGGNGHWYERVGDYLDVNNRFNWHDSKTMAEAREHLGMKGHLVTISSAAENQFVIDNLHAAHPWPTWLGFTDSELYGGTESFGQPNPQVDGWVWVTGEPITFTGWLPGSPDQTQVNEDAALMGSQNEVHHLWNDAQPSDHAPFFVEYEPLAVPDAAPLVFPASVAILLAMRRIWR